MSFNSPLADFVTGDVASLAAHMRDCEQSRGPMFRLRGKLQAVQSVAAGRIVTLACVTVVLGCGLMSIV